MLKVASPVRLRSIGAWVRLLSASEAGELADLCRRRNVFARHSWENDFYVRRISELSETSVIEVHMLGQPHQVWERASEVADMVETALMLSTVFALDRKSLHRRLAVTSHRREVTGLAIGPGFRYLRSNRRPVPAALGVMVDKRVANRFERLRFEALIAACLGNSDLGRRLTGCLKWLLESRLDSSEPAALVKSAIALETLLVVSDSEPVARSLAERIAFILGFDGEDKQSLARFTRSFYDARSAVVHGGKRKARPLPGILAAIDRIATMAALTVGLNSAIFRNGEALSAWCDQSRWGLVDAPLDRPFRQTELRRALGLAEVSRK